MDKIRNFTILAHIDHGKSTLADRFLEITQTLPKEKIVEQTLDRLDLERERGITIKLTPVTMGWKGYTLNLIDTPGHVDFTYEVSRALRAVEGAILLIDATTGIAAQTLSNYRLTLEAKLKLIPVINKIDHPFAQTESLVESLIEAFKFEEVEILKVSAKTGQNVANLLDKVIKVVPVPREGEKSAALIFDSFYDPFKGVVAFVRVFGGFFKSGDRLKLVGQDFEADAVEVGIFTPDLRPKLQLSSGEIGYIATGVKNPAKVLVGDTIALFTEKNPQILPGFRKIKPLVYASFYPANNNDFPLLFEALQKFKLNDASLFFEPESSAALGLGFRCGFLGLLHLEIVQERLEREYNLDLVASSPTVKYLVELTSGSEIEISNPTTFPLPSQIKKIKEPIVNAEIVTPSQYIGGILELIQKKRGRVNNYNYVADQVIIEAKIPLFEVIADFFDKLKSISSGFASFDYDLASWEEVEAVKLDVLVAGSKIDALSQIIVKRNAQIVGRRLVEKLKGLIPRQQFEVSLQAAVGGKILARADIPSYRKDVTAKLYGGDRTRKDKLLQKQKKGKKRMKMVGRVEIPQEAFLLALKI